MSRDYIAEFDKYLTDRLPDGDFVAPVVSAEIVEELRSSDPDLLSGWLDVRAEVILTDFIGTRDRTQRAKAVRQRAAVEFNSAAEKLAAGDPEPMRVFRERLVVSADNLRRPIGDMTKDDHLFVASEHTRRSEAALLEASFHKAIAKKIPAGKTTKDVMSEEDYVRIRDSIRPKTRNAA